MKKCVRIAVWLMITLFLAGCAENKERIPFKEAESMMTVAYAYSAYCYTGTD